MVIVRSYYDAKTCEALHRGPRDTRRSCHPFGLLTGRPSITAANAVYRGYLSADRTNLTIWVSNSTPRMVVVKLESIEARHATNWRRFPLWTDKPSPIPQVLGVPPFTAAEKQVTVPTPLEPASWKLNAV